MNENGWDDILSAASRLQGQVREAVLVGGTAAALFAHHRTSYDADHVVVDLKSHFDEVLADLESVAGWKTARIKRPVLILGSLDGVETGIRQLIRSEPLETTEIYAKGQKITVPTENEILRIKGALILKRNATRDYLDFAALSKHLGPQETVKALERLDVLYPQPNGASAAQQLCIQLASPLPYDREKVDFTNYKNLQSFWQKWENVLSQCQDVGFSVFAALPHTQNLNINNQLELSYKEKLAQVVGTKNEQVERITKKMALLIEKQKMRIAETKRQRPGALAYLFQGKQWKRQLLAQQKRLEQLVTRLDRLELLKNSVGQKRVEAMAMRKLGLHFSPLSSPEHAQQAVVKELSQQQSQGRSHSLTKRISR